MGEAGPELVVTPDPAARAGALLAELAGRADVDRGRARVAIAGGSAVSALPAFRARMAPDAWARLHLTWVDERCVLVADPESNRGAAHAAGLADHPVGLELPLWEDGETPEAALARIRAGLTERFDDGLDAVLLGMGPDGHVASLFPDRPQPRGDRVAYIADSPKPPPRRITLTRPLLATAPGCVLYAAGESKRAALERLLAGDPALPATGLPGLIVITDIALAGPTA